MEKLLDTISNSCEELKAKGIFTDDDYNKCKKISDDEPIDSMRDNEYSGYLNKVYENPSDEIRKHETDKYNKYRLLFISNKKNLMQAYNVGDKTLINRYNNNLNKIKDEIKELIKTYETNINNTKSHEIYKEMILKNREMTDTLKQIDKNKNDLMIIRKKKENIVSKNHYKHISFKNYLICFTILIFITLSLILELKYKI